MIEAARAFLSAHLSIPLGQIDVLYIEPAEWPDTSLGCPEPDRLYAQVLTAGYRAVLRVGNQQYELHTDSSGKQIVLCPGPVPGERVPLRRARSLEEIVALARGHLAERLSVPLEAVELVSIEDALWDDNALGCAQPPGHQPDRALPGPVAGYLIVLRAEGTTYEYHSGRLWLVFCGEMPG